MSQRKFAVFDIDGTIFRYALIHAVIDEMVASGDLPPGSGAAYEEELRQWQNRTHSESFRAFAMAQVQLFESHIKNLRVAQVEAAAKKVLSERSAHTYVYTRDLLKQLRSDGYFLIAISGSLAEVAHPFAKQYGFDDVMTTEYHAENGRYTGHSTLRHTDKHLFIEQLVKKHDLTMTDSIAIGDSTGDISMLEMVEKPIAFNPEKNLFEHAKSRNWKVVIERKNMVYSLEMKDGHYQLV
jgi:HAD superfamily hydrolase (TIGR01490 family)